MLALVIASIVLTWLLCAAVCIGIGSLLLRALRFSFSPSNAFWTGLALILGFLQIYHFLRPIDVLADSFLLAAGIAGWLWNGRSLLEKMQEICKTQLAALVLFLPAAVAIAFRAAGPCEHYDTGLYGAQAIRWFVSYPMVPGLANLLGQFGFNSSVLLWMAALDQGPWNGLAHHLFVSFLVAAFLASAIAAFLRVLRVRNISPPDWFSTFLFVPAAIWAATGKIVGFNTDLPTSIVSLVGAGLLFGALEGAATEAAQDDGKNEARLVNLLVAMLLFSLAVAFKISSIVFASLCWTLAFVKLWRANRRSLRGKSLLAWAVILSALIVVPWICRGLVLSGYAFFPNTAVSIPAEWKMAAGDAQTQAEFARSFARVPEITYEYAHGWKWLKPWFGGMEREREGFVIPLLLVMAGGLIGIAGISGERRSTASDWYWLPMAALGGALFWFLEAPAVRFGEPVLWTAGATVGTMAAVRLGDRPGKIRMVLAGLVLMTAWAAHPRLLWGSYFRPSVGVRTFLRLPEVKLAPHQTASGLTISSPVETNQCWDAPLPCSPFIKETLRLRRPGRLNKGFTTGQLMVDERPE